MRAWLPLLFSICCTALQAADVAATTAETPAAKSSWRERFVDPQDGKFDASDFLASAYGFVPIGSIITDPAVGYGGALGLIFVDPNEDSATQQPLRPNLALAGAFATENGSWGGATGHSGLWQGGQLKTLAGAFYTSLNLEFFGEGAALENEPLEYNLEAWGTIAQADRKIGETSFWAGLRYVFADVTTEFDLGNVVPGLRPLDYDQRMSGLTPIVSYDTRDNFFTPSRGVYAEASVAAFSEALGGDADFQIATLTGMWYRPFAPQLSFGVKGDFSASFDDVPFYLRPYVQLRGIQSLRLQGENLAQAEVELRWQRWGRYSLVAFAGGGVVWNDLDNFNNERSTATGGLGIRYLAARLFGLHMGFDIGFGPDDPIFYIQFGSAWFRP
jgi:Omp85 superfamily domain